MDTRTAIEKTRKAILRAVEEHGAPNTFAPGELAREHAAPSPMSSTLTIT